MAKGHSIVASVPTAPLNVNASLPLLVRLEQLVRYDKKVRDPANVEELHEMRMAMKWLRYTLEIFADAVQDSAGALQTLKHLQHLLGQIHDTDILLPIIQQDLEGETPKPGLRHIYETMTTDRESMYKEFISAWDDVVAEGFPIRLWNASLAASARPGAPVIESLAKDRLLPSKRTRRIDITVALVRLIPYAAAVASPENARSLLVALDLLEHAATDPMTDSKDWAKILGTVCSLIGGAAD